MISIITWWFKVHRSRKVYWTENIWLPTLSFLQYYGRNRNFQFSNLSLEGEFYSKPRSKSNITRWKPVLIVTMWCNMFKSCFVYRPGFWSLEQKLPFKKTWNPSNFHNINSNLMIKRFLSPKDFSALMIFQSLSFYWYQGKN